MTPGTGAIRAMTAVIPGNRHNEFNLTSQSARQAGSTFKTFVLTAAIEKGIDPNNTYYESAPFTCTTGPWCVDDYKAGKPWQVTTFDHTYAGSISITNATLRSDNTVYAQLTLDVGPDTVYKLAQKLGVNFAGQKPVASIGLGSLSVSPLDMAAAYATFAAGGIYAKPTAIRKVILPNGKVDTTAGWGKPQSKRVMSQGVAWQVNQVLAANAQYGTGSGSSDGVHPECRQDRDDLGLHGRLVRRLHARLLDGGLDGIPARRDPDDRRARRGGHRRDVPGSDVAPLHGGSREEPARPAVPHPELLPDLRAVREGLLGLSGHSGRTHAEHDDVDHGRDAGEGSGRPEPEAGAHPARRSQLRSRPAALTAAVWSSFRASIVSGMTGLLTIAEALELVLEHVRPLEAEDVPLDDAAGRVLAEAAAAAVDLPSFPASAMDGFALRSGDAPAPLPIVARIAGRTARPSGRSSRARRWRSPRAVSFRTGPMRSCRSRMSRSVTVSSSFPVRCEPVPTYARVAAISSAATQSSRRACGSEPVQLGALAAAGVTSVRCHRRPEVVLAVTGSELRSAGEPLGRGEIYDANGIILATQIRSTGATVERLPPVKDDAAATREAIERGLEADVLVTSGGVSVGVYDLVRATEAELGVEEVFWRVAVRPGKPIAFGVRGRTLVFGLPGNPVSSLVGFELFVRPALLALQGLAQPRPAFRPGRLGREVKMVGRDSLLRSRTAVEDGEVVLYPLTGQESHMIAKAATADALVLIPRGEGRLEAGSAVTYLSL